MAKIWIENGVVKCCSDVCGAIVSGGDAPCHRIDRCEYIDSPILLALNNKALADSVIKLERMLDNIKVILLNIKDTELQDIEDMDLDYWISEINEYFGEDDNF